MYRLILVVLLAIVMAACTEPRQTRLPDNLEQWETDREFQEAVRELTLEEQNILKTYLIRVTMDQLNGVEVPKGQTIAEAIAAQEVYIEAWRKQDEARKAEERARARFKDAYMEQQVGLVDFKVKEKRLNGGDGIRRIVSGALVNNGDRPLSDVRVTVSFRDMKGFTITEKTYAPIEILNGLKEDAEPFVFEPKKRIVFNYPVVDEVAPGWGGLATAMVTDIVFHEAAQATAN